MTFIVPIYWTHGARKPKTTMLGMNWYRNAHHFTLNAAKSEIEELILNQLSQIGPVLGPYKLHISVFYKNPSSDGSNIVAIIEKFFLDAAQKSGTFREDNVLNHFGTTWTIAGQDKLNPRAEVTIHPAKEPDDQTRKQ